jgi:hypothetical protein
MIQLINIALFWVFFGFWTAYLARKRGRNPNRWFWVGLGLGILGVLLVVVLPKPAIKKPAIKVQAKPVFELPPEKKWFYLTESHEQKGPFLDLAPTWKSQEINENSFIWTEGMGEWKRLKELPQLYRDLSSLKE